MGAPTVDKGFQEQPATLIKSVARAMTILETFDAHGPVLTSRDVVDLTGTNRATVYRFLQTLTSLGYVEPAGDGGHRLGLRALSLGHAALASHEFREVALPYAQKLYDSTGVTVNLALRDDDEIVYIARLKAEGLLDIKLYVGSRLPVYATSLGRAILAHLPEAEREALVADLDIKPFTEQTVRSRADLEKILDGVRADGFALNEGELELGLAGVAVPILDSTGYPRAAINIAYARHSHGARPEKLVPQLKDTASAISDAMSMIPAEAW